MNILTSPSLRKVANVSYGHGWFKISIYFKAHKKDPEIIEQWYLFHLPYQHSESVPYSNTDLSSIKQHTYRSYSQTLRSIYSIINALPVTTLSIVLSEIQLTKPPIIYAEVSPFQKFPAKIEKFCEQETSRIQFKTTYSPIGKTTVICKFRLDILTLIPSPIRTAPHIDLSGSMKSAQSYEDFAVSGQEEAYGTSIPQSEYTRFTQSVCEAPPLSFVPNGVGPMSIGDVSQKNEMDIDEFIEFLESYKDKKCEEFPKVGDIWHEFQIMNARLEKLLNNNE
ncbi:hypothetical protein GPJ56_010868 [Histomonas meleagridis]|uniref:uncharacterized protein n=1 Tax=Histomonas meleagridis TaxID=135588 RepID=UPI0035593BAD|nr:hypothetical protein GPJ56_010868 [Histomonas meleagridis]KAH0803710.1 hypothetical protein GO595_003484 [Histomonas meleagridis]